MIFFFIIKETDFSNYADDNTIKKTVDTNEEVIKSLESDSTVMFKWFVDNKMKANISKCYLLINKKDEVVINLGETKIEKLLGIKVDTKLNVNEHLNDMINRKVSALSRVVHYMSLSKKKILMNFSYSTI